MVESVQKFNELKYRQTEGWMFDFSEKKKQFEREIREK